MKFYLISIWYQPEILFDLWYQVLEMLSSDILFDIHIASLYLALEMLSSEILFDIHIASLWYQALEMLSK